MYIYICVCVHSLSTIRKTKQQNVRCNTPSSAIGLARSWHWHSSCLAPGALYSRAMEIFHRKNRYENCESPEEMEKSIIVLIYQNHNLSYILYKYHINL